MNADISHKITGLTTGEGKLKPGFGHVGMDSCHFVNKSTGFLFLKGQRPALITRNSFTIAHGQKSSQVVILKTSDDQTFRGYFGKFPIWLLFFDDPRPFCLPEFVYGSTTKNRGFGSYANRSYAVMECLP